MKLKYWITTVLCTTLLGTNILPAGEYAALVKIRATAPGGAFLEGESLEFRLNNIPPPGKFRITDWKGTVVRTGEWRAGDSLTLDVLPRGHYRLEHSAGVTPFAVLPDPNGRVMPKNQFLTVDTHISWTGKGNTQAGYSGEPGFEFIAELVRRMGVPALRDRISWRGVNPKPGKFDFSKYRVQLIPVAKRNIEVLSVFHDSPGWTNGNQAHNVLPVNLFATYDFCRELAKKHAKTVQYWEFWNEQDIGFSLDPAWDYAANMKAAYLGFKAGNPDVIVLPGACCTTVPENFCMAMLKNDLSSYFDIFNYHTYLDYRQYPDLVRNLRNVLQAAGVRNTMPIWFSEFGSHADGKTAEEPGPKPEIREHSFRQEIAIGADIPKKCAVLQQLGIARGFWFNLMPVYEWNGSKSWGLIRSEYTIKASYSAFANLTFQLGSAKPLGKMELGGNVEAFLYEQPDKSQTLLLWSENPCKIKLPGQQSNATATDLFGGPFPLENGDLAVDAIPVYVNRLSGLCPSLAAVPSGTLGADSPADMDKNIILKIHLPEALRIAGMKDSVEMPNGEQRIGLDLYNFSDEAKTGDLSVTGGDVRGNLSGITIPARGKIFVEMTVTPQFKKDEYRGELVWSGIFNGKRISRLSLPFMQRNRMLNKARYLELPFTGTAAYWKGHTSGKLRIEDVKEENAVRFSVDFPENVDRWVYPQYKLQLPQESLQGAAGIAFDVRVEADDMKTKFTGVNLRGTYNGLHSAGFKVPTSRWETRNVIFSKNFDLANTTLLEIGFNPLPQHFSYLIRNVRILYLD